MYMQVNDSNTPLHLLKPDYDIQYEIPLKENIKFQLVQILNYLEKATPSELINKKNNLKISDNGDIDENTEIADSNFRLTSYEWGVTYAGMLYAGNVTKNDRFIEYTFKRLKMIAALYFFYNDHKHNNLEKQTSIHSVLFPQALDDAGALCCSMIKAEMSGLNIGLRPLIDNLMDYIYTQEFRLFDGTLARNRPYPNTLWLDDLFMSVPALAQMTQLTGDHKYIDDAVEQVLKFSKRMFNKEKGLYIHGWVQGMSVHPEFFWGRANGWAVMAIVELLDVLQSNHSNYKKILEQLRAHINGLAACQSGTGFWHQLLDRNDTYFETSATAIFTFSIARAVNKGLIDKFAFAPIAILGWNAVSSKINNIGQIEGTCVGTGMGFDPAFYSYRPVNVFAAHGYGSTLLAGSEIIRLIENHSFEMVEGSLQLKS